MTGHEHKRGISLMRIFVGIYIAILLILFALWPITGGASLMGIPFLAAAAILHGIGYVITS